MKAKRIIIGIVFLLPFGWMYLVLNQTKQLISPEDSIQLNTSKSETPQRDQFITKKDIYAHYATNQSTASSSNHSPKIVKKKDVVESFVNNIDSKSLEKYEGNYTVREFKEKEADKPFTLNSSWIIWNKKLPQLETALRKNEETGEYELIGGGIYFPTKGLGVSYERDKETDETRAYLNLKKSF